MAWYASFFSNHFRLNSWITFGIISKRMLISRKFHSSNHFIRSPICFLYIRIYCHILWSVDIRQRQILGLCCGEGKGKKRVCTPYCLYLFRFFCFFRQSIQVLNYLIPNHKPTFIQLSQFYSYCILGEMVKLHWSNQKNYPPSKQSTFWQYLRSFGPCPYSTKYYVY